MLVHGIQTFQKLRQPRKDLDVCLKAISPQNLLCFPLHKCSIDLRITAETNNRISTDCKCIDRCTFFIEGHIHLIRHQDSAGMLGYLLIYLRCDRLCTKDHDKTYHGFTRRKAADNSDHRPYRQSGLKIDHCRKKDSKRYCK